MTTSTSTPDALISLINPFMYRLNSDGYRTHPCLRLIFTGNQFVKLPLIFTEPSIFWYNDFKADKNFSGTSILFKCDHNLCLLILSYALLKSINPTYVDIPTSFLLPKMIDDPSSCGSS